MKPIVNKKSCLSWSNWHKSITVGGITSKILQPTNTYESGTPVAGKEFVPGLRGLKSIIDEAQKKKKRVRAFGSRWSLNNIAYTNEYLVDSTQLNYLKVGLTKTHLTDKYKGKSDSLVLAQCGLMVRALNTALEAKDLALPTSGASDGQRIVGAIATGTHGSAHAVGAMTEYVRGIHVVVQDRHVLIQRTSDLVVNDHFGQWLDDAEIINDDELFNAVLVGFGGFGLIHALILEVEPQYYLERVIKNYDVSQVRQAITKLDLSGLGLPQGNKLPFHFECTINPYHIKDGEKGAYVRVYYRHESDDNLSKLLSSASDTPDIHTSMGKETTKEVLEFVGRELESLVLSDDESPEAKLMGLLVDVGLASSFPLKKPDEPIRPPGKWFTGENSADPKTKAPVGGTSIELGVPFNRVGDAMDLVVKTMQEHPFAAPVAFRYVKKSTATLGFTGLADITVTMELPGAWGKALFKETGDAHIKLFEALAKSDIPHSYHWGQQFPKNTSWVTKAYGKNAVTEWKEQREKLLKSDGLRMFGNALMMEIGLAKNVTVSTPNIFCRTIALVRLMMGKEA